MTRPGAPAIGSDAAPAEPNAAQVRILTIIVIVLGVLLLLGLVAVVGRIIYLGSQRTPLFQQPPSSSSTVVAVPAGAIVKHTAVSGDRLAITYEASQRTGVIVVNLLTGQVISRVEFAPDVPR